MGWLTLVGVLTLLAAGLQRDADTALWGLLLLIISWCGYAIGRQAPAAHRLEEVAWAIEVSLRASHDRDPDYWHEVMLELPDGHRQDPLALHRLNRAKLLCEFCGNPQPREKP